MLTVLTSLVLIGLGSYGMYNLDVAVVDSGWEVVADIRVGSHKILCSKIPSVVFHSCICNLETSYKIAVILRYKLVSCIR